MRVKTKRVSRIRHHNHNTTTLPLDLCPVPGARGGAPQLTVLASEPSLSSPGQTFPPVFDGAAHTQDRPLV